MNWKHITAVILTVFLAVGMTIAQPPAGRPGMGRGQRGLLQQKPGLPPGPGFHEGCFGLNLTDEQQVKIQQLRLEQQREMIKIKSEVSNLRDKLKLAVTADKFDAKAVNDMTGKLAKVQQQRMMMKAKHLRKVRDILTDEQRVKFDQKVLSGRFGFGHGGCSGMCGPKGDRPHRGRRPCGPGMW